jgi:hypothetical protein
MVPRHPASGDDAVAHRPLPASPEADAMADHCSSQWSCRVLIFVHELGHSDRQGGRHRGAQFLDCPARSSLASGEGKRNT